MVGSEKSEERNGKIYSIGSKNPGKHQPDEQGSGRMGKEIAGISGKSPESGRFSRWNAESAIKIPVPELNFLVEYVYSRNISRFKSSFFGFAVICVSVHSLFGAIRVIQVSHSHAVAEFVSGDVFEVHFSRFAGR